MLILGIETSCDETAAAVLQGGRELLSDIVYSQVAVHRPYGGVVPELASRNHLDKIVPVVEEALNRAGIGFKDLDGLAVTRGPGLVGALLIGLSFAKAVSAACRIPLVGINHLEGHICSIFLEQDVPCPFLSLTVSGGHTSLYLVREIGSYQLLGQTRDDAAGEAFDKVAKLLQLGYPGGGVIEELARQGRPSIPFPRAIPSRDTLDFSFSGLKTAVVNYVKKFPQADDGAQDLPVADIACSFQEAVVDMLIRKVKLARQETDVPRLALSGGVVSNGYLRERFQTLAGEEGLELYIPDPRYCTDNAAMIAWLGGHYLEGGRRDDLDLDALSRWPVGQRGNQTGAGIRR
jgi:N6-L-threonylcarbamoyladenine synthase